MKISSGKSLDPECMQLNLFYSTPFILIFRNAFIKAIATLLLFEYIRRLENYGRIVLRVSEF